MPTQAARIPADVLDAARAVMRHHAARHDALHAATIAATLATTLAVAFVDRPEPAEPD